MFFADRRDKVTSLRRRQESHNRLIYNIVAQVCHAAPKHHRPLPKATAHWPTAVRGRPVPHPSGAGRVSVPEGRTPRMLCSCA